MNNIDLYIPLINILNDNGYSYIIDNNDEQKYIAIGIGDILFKLLNIQENLASKPVYINLDIFQNGKFKLNDNSKLDIWFDNPQNNFIFRITLLNDMIKHNPFLNKKDFIFIISKFNACIMTRITNFLNYDKINNFKLLIDDNFYINNTISDNIKEFISTPYIIFHTKLRLNNNFNYNNIKKKLNNFFSQLKIKKFNIILIGEKIFPQTFEKNLHGITTIYQELLKLYNHNSNKILDLTQEIIYNELDYNNYKNDLYLIHKTNYNICYGQGGSLCSSLLFGKTIFFDPIDEKYFFKNLNLYNSGHRYFKNIDMMNKYLLEVL